MDVYNDKFTWRILSSAFLAMFIILRNSFSEKLGDCLPKTTSIFRVVVPYEISYSGCLIYSGM